MVGEHDGVVGVLGWVVVLVTATGCSGWLGNSAFQSCCINLIIYNRWNLCIVTVQWTPSNPATIGTNNSVLIRGAASFQRENLY